MGVLDGGGDRRRQRDSFGVNLGRFAVTNGTATRSSQIILGGPVVFLPILVNEDVC